jgi:histidine triad (HIT) family protein
MTNCVFCKIAAGEIPSNKVYEDERVLVFHDLNPVAPVHVLIVPKQHFTGMNDFAAADADGALAAHLTRLIPQVADLVGLKDDGYRLINNCGAAAGQTVPHFHIHLIGGRDLGERLL